MRLSEVDYLVLSGKGQNIVLVSGKEYSLLVSSSGSNIVLALTLIKKTLNECIEILS